MVIEGDDSSAASREKADRCQSLGETFSQEAGQMWVVANPGIVRTVLAAYPHFGKTVLMSRDEFSGAGEHHG